MKTPFCFDDDCYVKTLRTQIGHGSAVPSHYVGVRRQRGAGIFSFLAKMAIPLLGNLMPHVLPFATRAISNVASDVINKRRNFKTSVRDNAKQAMGDIKSSVAELFSTKDRQSGSGINRRAKKRSLDSALSVLTGTIPKKRRSKAKQQQQQQKRTKKRDLLLSPW